MSDDAKDFIVFVAGVVLLAGLILHAATNTTFAQVLAAVFSGGVNL